jgi:hypothetical protein
MLGLAFIAAVLGFAALALAMSRHHQQVWRRAPSRRRQWLLRLAGWGLLLASLGVCKAHAGWSSGLVWWFGLLTAGALAVALALAYLPRALRWIAPST